MGVAVLRNDKFSNSWVTDAQTGKLMESELIMAIQLRTNTLPTLSVLRREVIPASFLDCRLCGCGKETPFHVISCCRELKLNRMSNHNKVCDFLRKEGENHKWRVLSEKRLKTYRGWVGVPDLIVVRKSKALVIDVTICFERDINTLEAACAGKVRKYNVFKKAVADLLPRVNEVECFGFPMGACGDGSKT